MPIIGPLWVNDIWWDLHDRNVIEAFIKPGVSCNFDAGAFWITPLCVPSGARDTAKENTLARVGFQLGRFLTRRLDPHTAAKSAKIGEVFLLASCEGDW